MTLLHTRIACALLPAEEHGVRVRAVRPGSLFQALGLQKGDVIRSVNGQDPRGTLPLSTLLEQAVQTRFLRLEVERERPVGHEVPPPGAVAARGAGDDPELLRSCCRTLGVVLGMCLAFGPYAGASAQDPATPRPTPAARSPRTEGPRKAADLALIGLIIREGADGIAIIEDRRTRRQGLYRVGAMIGGGRLTEILPDRVTLVFVDGEVELRLAGTPAEGTSAPPPSGPVVVIPQPEPSPPPPVPEPVGETSSPFPRIDRGSLDQLIRAPDPVMNVTPVEDRGVRVDEVRKASLFEVLGLRKGDIIRNVNGRVPGAADPLPRIIEQAVETGILRFELERNGRMDVKYLQIRP